MPELNLILLGPPGSGKGTQGERLQEDFRLPYYATGDILRTAVKEGTEIGKQAKEFMDRGDLVPDEVIIGVIAERLQQDEAADGFILDGFPRTVPQAEALGQKMKELKREMTAALLIAVPEDEVGARPPGRRPRGRGRAPARWPPHGRGEPGPHLPRRVRPPEGGGRLRHRRRQADR